MLKQIKKILLYAGIDKESYQQITGNINRVNRAIIAMFSGIGTILIGIMYISSLVLNGMAQNRNVYLAGFCGILLIFFSALYLAKKYLALSSVLVHIVYLLLMTYGVLIGTITNPTQQTVTFMVMLVFLPVLFTEPPYKSVLKTLTFEVIFIVLCFQNKSGDVLSTDVLDAIIYGILGSVGGCIITHIKVRSYVLEYELHNASRLDQLTKMNNRNSFEEDLKQYPLECQSMISCIYIDVNGLHEINDTKGHQYGDLMLQYVADSVKDIFGQKATYRIGGDEFVAFAVDLEEEKLQQKIAKLQEMVEKGGYHVAVGHNCMDKDKIEMDLLLKLAERAMYQCKSEYYKNNRIDRRARS